MSSLTDYIAESRRRLKARFAARGAAAVALAALAVTGLFAVIFVALVPSGGWVIAARVLLYIGIAAAIALLVWRPFTDTATAAEVESRAPAFAGRLKTWRDSTERGDDSPMLGLLTRETEAIANAEPPRALIPTKDIALPAAIAAVLVIGLVAASIGVSPWQLAAQRLWTGDLFTAAAPRITVTPGDTVIPRGADVVVEASASGFVARGMEMHAEFENAAAEETAPMSRLGPDRYGFVFVGVTEEVEYYVGAGSLNSERHVIKVADLPRVTSVSVQYTYPDWTELPVTERQDGDVAALPGTDVAITAITDAPVADPLIVVNGEVLDADAEGLFTRGEFAVAEPGSWHVALMHEGTLARISDSYFIDVVEDQPPEVAFAWPGHDSQATAIEEKTLRFTATDDYGIKTLTLSYAVNGGAWQPAELELPVPPADDEPSVTLDPVSEHVLYLEELTVPSPVGEEPRTLRPGDMISFYAEAMDHAQETRTALYFVDVRPFDRTYRESQTMAGQGGQGGGGATELVDRQREILSATWNLINKREEGEGEPADSDQAEVLALLQRTLKDQVTTLIQRAAARRLTLDDEIDTFTTELTAAVEDMEPAAQKLEAQELNDAIAPEQQALQHLLAAQATMTDVDVSMGQADMRGTAGRSLSELMDLEMDPERNRYEMPQSPNLNQQAQEESEEWQRLAELAARQEQLARQQRRGEDSLASRWQQERLQRELERLQEELERRQQQQAQLNQLSRQGQSGSSSRQAQQSMERAIEELNQAREAIDRSLQQAQGDPSASRQATEALERAAEQLREQALGNMDERLARTERSVQNLLSDQRNVMDRLDEVQDDALNARSGEPRRYDDYAMEPYGARKRRMQEDLNDVTREMGELSDAITDRETSRVLETALSELAQERVDERLAASADAFEFGRPLYAVGNEAAVERALERLADRLGQARRLLESSEEAGGGQSTLAQIRELRAQLGDALAGGPRDGRFDPSDRFDRDTGIGAYDTAEMEALFRQADALEFRLGQEFGEDLALDTTLSREAYLERGIDATNTEQLAQMMKDRLDLIEAAIMNLEAAPISAQEPREQERDSEAAARYFRDLGRSEG